MPIKKKTSQYYMDQKTKSKLGGINSSNVSQLKKIDKLVIKKEKPKVPTSEFYMYVNGKWQHKGQACRLCGLVLGTRKVQDNHQYICKVLNTKHTEDD
jgi:hypothetical protein